jgi:hypothetical protein
MTVDVVHAVSEHTLLEIAAVAEGSVVAKLTPNMEM